MDTMFASTLLAIVEQGTIAGAARIMGVTPGAIALRMKALERDVGAKLIDRVGRSVVPTAAARRLVPVLADIVAKTASLQHIASDIGSPSGELRLGAIATASTGTLPGVAAAVMRHYPGMDLVIEPGTSSELCARVRAGALDAAIIVQPDWAVRKSETFTTWFEEPLVMIAPPSSVSTDPLELIASQPFIRYDRRSMGGKLVDSWIAANGLAVHDRIELDVLDGIVAMVAAGLGVSIIPDWRGPRPEGASVTTISLPPPAFVRRIGLFHLTISPRQDLVDLMTPVFRTMVETDR